MVNNINKASPRSGVNNTSARSVNTATVNTNINYNDRSEDWWNRRMFSQNGKPHTTVGIRRLISRLNRLLKRRQTDVSFAQTHQRIGFYIDLIL